MPTFQYRAKDTAGRDLSGIIDAATPSSAASALREQGLFPLKIEAVSGKAAKEAQDAFHTLPDMASSGPSHLNAAGAQARVDIAPFLVSVPLPDLAAMYRQLATLLRAGVPMFQAMQALASQTRPGRLQKVLTEAGQAIASGNPLSATLARYPSVFTPLQTELIRAGELGGMLEGMCSRIADYLEREIDIRRKLKRETLYPKIVLSVAGLVILVIGFAGAGFGKAGTAFVVAKLTFAAIVAASVFGDRKSTRLNSSHSTLSRMPSSA